MAKANASGLEPAAARSGYADVLSHALALLPAEGRRLVETIRRGEPVRNVEGSRSVTGRFPSFKMRRTIQFESRGLEGAACSLYEDDVSVLEYYDQPCVLQLNWNNGTRNVSAGVTPDFFVIRTQEGPDRDPLVSFSFVQWHPRTEVEKDAKKHPRRYESAGDGRWLDRAGEVEARRLGLSFELLTEDDISTTRARNVGLLYDYRRAPHPVAASEHDAIHHAVRVKPGMLLAELIHDEAHAIDDVLAMIAQRELWTDLDNALLTDHAHVRLFDDAADAAFIASAPKELVHRSTVKLEDGARLVWKDRTYQIARAGSEDIDLVSGEGRALTLRRSEIERLVAEGKVTGGASLPPSRSDFLAGLSDKQRERWRQNQAMIESALRGGPAELNRAGRRLLRQYRESENLTGDGYRGLAPDFHRSGRRGARTDEAAEAIATAVIREVYMEKGSAVSLRQSWNRFRTRCTKAGVHAFSWEVFRQRAAGIPIEEREGARRGPRARAAARPRYDDQATPALPKDGDRAFGRVHLDHTEEDLWLRDSQTRQPLGRPWLSIAIDAFTKMVLAFVVMFDAPSAVTDLLLIRELIRRRHRFPSVIVTDHGSDFRSKYLQQLLAENFVTIEYRPKGSPRYGGIGEEIFDKVHSDLTHGLMGNTKISKTPRLATGAFAPKRNAVWTLGEFEVLLEEYFDIYNRAPDATLGIPPLTRLDQSLSLTGARPATLVAYDRAFLIDTCPSTREGTALAGPQGVKIQGVRYWWPGFADPKVRGTTVPVRYDPFNRAIAYAKVAGEWRECRSSAIAAALQGKTAKEIEYCSIELRQRLHGRQASELELASFMENRVAPTQERLLHERRAAEQRVARQQRDLRVIGNEEQDEGVSSSAAPDTADDEMFPSIPRDSIGDLPADLPLRRGTR